MQRQFASRFTVWFVERIENHNRMVSLATFQHQSEEGGSAGTHSSTQAIKSAQPTADLVAILANFGNVMATSSRFFALQGHRKKSQKVEPSVQKPLPFG
jgi:hypothetical protein